MEFILFLKFLFISGLYLIVLYLCYNYIISYVDLSKIEKFLKGLIK